MTASAPAATPALGDAPVTEGVSLPGDSQYATDPARAWVYDPSMEALSTINEILCITSMTAYDDMVNAGPYTARIDTAKCTSGSDSGEQGESLIEVFTVESSRASNASPQIVNFWVPSTDPQDEEGPIFAQMTIQEGASETNPFGVLEMSFAAAPNAAGVAESQMIGHLSTFPTGSSNLGFEFFMAHGDLAVVPAAGEEAGQVAVSVSMTSDQSAGSARVQIQQRRNDPWNGGDSGIQVMEYKVAFDATHMKRQLDGETPVELSRTDVEQSVWRYNLYEAEGPNAGRRVELESGFGFRTAGGAFGHIGYYGMWAPDGVSLSSGETITRESWGEAGHGDAYTLVKAPGKLIRHTRHQLDLADLVGTTLEMWDQALAQSFLVEYSSGAFWKIAVRDPADGSWDEIVSEMVDVAAAGGYLHLWSGSLNGSVSYTDGAPYVTYFEQVTINDADPLFDLAVGGKVRLFGLVDCLKAEITRGAAESGNVFLANAASVAEPHVFRMGKADLTLYHDALGDGSDLARVGLKDGAVPQSGPFVWGMRSGPLVTSLAGVSSVWQVWDLDEFYVYETGANTWNQFASLRDADGAAVVFDAPIQFTYRHQLAADRNGDATYSGQTFMLNYGGPGDLWGIPHEPMDLDGDGEPDRWLPLFSIADGTLVGPTDSEFALRGMEAELRLREDVGGAPGLDLSSADALTLPDAGGYSPPQMGDAPVVPGPPAVIDGEVQPQG